MSNKVDDNARSQKELEGEDTSAENIGQPFDPNLIRVRQITLTVYSVLQKLQFGEIDLAPEFQRKAGIWKDEKQSALIESLLIRIPMPAFYLDELDRDLVEGERYAVVDGIQRMTALMRFVGDKSEGRLRLRNLEFLSRFNAHTFEQLPSSLQRRILESQLVAYVIEPGTPDAAKLNIFKRINTGGLMLSAQEIRHAMNPGQVRGFLETLAKSDEFKLATDNGVRDDRMDDRECALRFCAFVDGGDQRYVDAKSVDFDGFLNTAMRRINRMSQSERDYLERRFVRAMRAAHDILGTYAFRRIASSNRRGPVNKALFESISVALDTRDDDQLSLLKNRKDHVIDEYTKAVNLDEVRESITSGTGDVRRVKLRFDAMYRLFWQISNGVG